jgi:CSLREA domain-containing protein
LLVAWSAALPPAAHAFVVRGTGEAALVGHDLTDPEDDGDPENNTNYNATFSSSEEPGFGGGEAAFNVFDNKVDGGGNNKWCCGDQGNFPASPLFIDATFPAAIVLRHFTLTSGNDSPERDPLVWKIEGSNDGVNFTTIYARTNPTTSVWTDREQVVEFAAGIDYAVPAAYTTIRFSVSKTQSFFQLSEIEYFDTPPENLIVTTTADEDNGTSDPSQGTGTSLREALKYAATLSGPQTITFSNGTAFGAVNFFDGTARTITLGGTELTLTSDVTIAGPGAKRLSISGNNASRVFTVNAGKTATLGGLTISGGSSNPGGGVSNSGTLTLQNCTISGNTAPGGAGSGILNASGAMLMVQNSTIANNPGAAGGGGIFNNGGTVTIENSTISGNSASLGGGGIYNNATLTVQNSTITGNPATNQGGGIRNASASAVILENSIVAGNTSASGPDFESAGAAGITSNGYNFIGDTSGINGGVQPGDKTFASTGKTLADLLETAAGVPVLKDNGGATFTVALVPGSPALDAGDPNFNPNNFTPPRDFDQRGLGFDRVVQGKSASAAAIVDIGAFEVQIINFAPGVAANGLQMEASDGPLDLNGPTVGASPGGGTFSGPGVDANGVFHPENLEPGTYTISYTTTTPDAYGNTGSRTFTITITATNPYVRIVATVGPGGTGIDVPGEKPGTKFTQLGLASMDDGMVGARVKIKPVVGAEVQAIFLGNVTDGAIVVRGGEPAPDTAGTFANFGEPVFGGEQFAFTATLAGVPKANDTGLWSTMGGSLALVAGEGLAAPDGDGNALTGAVFDKIQSYALSADGESLSFVATLKGTGVTGTTKTGVWQQRLQMGGPGTLTRLIFRTGDLFQVTTDFNDINNPFDDTREDQPVKSLKLFVPAKTIPGQRRSYSMNVGNLFVFAKFPGPREGVLSWADNGFFFQSKFLALENTNVGHPGLPSVNSSGFFAMRAGLSIGAVLAGTPNVKVTGKNDQTILTGRSNNNLGILSQEGSPVSNTNPEIFTAFEEPAFNDSFRTAFFAKVKAPGLPASQTSVLIYAGFEKFGNQPTVLARTGIAAADLTGGELWKEFTAMALPDSGYGPIFLAKLSGPGVTPKNNIGLWATDLDGSVRLLLRTGSTIPVNGAHKTVSLINTLGAALDSSGQGRYVDLDGNVSALLTFTDGTTALVHFGMPTPLP